jgi:hypothetical protein
MNDIQNDLSCQERQQMSANIARIPLFLAFIRTIPIKKPLSYSFARRFAENYPPLAHNRNSESVNNTTHQTTTLSATPQHVLRHENE